MKKLLTLAFTAALLPISAIAGSGHDMDKKGKMNMANMDHSKMQMDNSDNQKMQMAMGTGIVNSISRMNNTVNVTHEPIPALNWPAMTMDIAVADNIDLKSLKIGEKINFHISQDADKVYRITEIMTGDKHCSMADAGCKAMKNKKMQQ